MNIIASELRAKSQLADDDGFLWTVEEIVRETAKTVTVRLCSHFSCSEQHWTKKRDGTPGGVLKTFRKTSVLQGIQP